MLADLFSRLFSVDERFIMHRYYSTRWAVIVGSILMGGWVMVEYYINHTLRIDILVILSAMAVTKLAAMLYYRLTH